MQPHPSENELRQLLAETLGHEKRNAIEGHIDTCRDCQTTLDRLTSLSQALPPITSDNAAKSGSAIHSEQPPAESLSIPGYEILGEIARGGMGVVYKARQRGLDRLVAIKMILAGPHAGMEELARFHTEAEAVAQLQHPNIVQIYQIGEHDRRPFLVLEFVAGGNLAEKLAGTPLPAREAAELVATLARAVHHAHDHGVVHRDLKPANVLLAGASDDANLESRVSGREPKTYSDDSSSRLSGIVLKISDFGLAKRLDDDSNRTRTGTILGTPSYMAPEQASESNPTSGPLSDVYSLGAILYEALTGRPPFKAPTVLETLEQLRSQEPVAPSRLVPKLPRDLDTICLKCLQKGLTNRYASAADLAEDLSRYLRVEPIVARPVGIAERTGKLVRRRPAATAAVGLLDLMLIGVAGETWWSHVRTGRALRLRESELDDQYQEQLASKQVLIEREQQLAKQAEVQHEQQLATQQALTEREQQLKQQEQTSRETSQQRAGIKEARQQLDQHRYDKAGEALGGIPMSRRGWEFERLMFLSSLGRSPAHYVGHHDWGVMHFIKSRDGGTIVSSGHDGRVIAWRADGGDKQELERGLLLEDQRCWRPALMRFEGEEPATPTPDCFLKLCWPRDGERVMGVSFRGRVVAWDLKDAAREEIYRHDRPLTSIAVSPDGETLVLADDKGELIYRRGNAGEWRKFTVGESAIMDVVMLSTDRCVVGEVCFTVARIAKGRWN